MALMVSWCGGEVDEERARINGSSDMSWQSSGNIAKHTNFITRHARIRFPSRWCPWKVLDKLYRFRGSRNNGSSDMSWQHNENIRNIETS